MSEQELKLHVPASARAGVEKELARGATSDIALHALYFDTPDRELAQARVAIRLRREGDHWVQTLKTPGAHALARLELNHPRPGPVLDLSVYADTPIAPVLAALRGELGVRYETEVMRRLRRVRHRHGMVEIAYDQGQLRADNLALPICEVEFELVSGDLQAVLELGSRWQQRFGLILDWRSKSERGDALAKTALQLNAAGPDGSPEHSAARASEIQRFWTPRGMQAVPLQARQTPHQALQAITLECLEQVARNAAILAEVDTAGVYAAGHPDHVHQLRIGLRRLRSAWRLFDGWTTLPSEALQTEAAALFGRFGATRDADVLRDTLMPRLEAAGMPSFSLPPAQNADQPAELAASRALQAWLLAMLAWALHTPPAAAPPQLEACLSGTADVAIIPMDAVTHVNLRGLLLGRLSKWHRRLVRDGKHFPSLDIESRHRLRKQAKRLRYGLAFAESLLPQSRLRQYRRRLAVVQEQMGWMNDLYVADDRMAELTATHPEAWFARGWIAAQLQQQEPHVQDALRALGRKPGFLRD